MKMNPTFRLPGTRHTLLALCLISSPTMTHAAPPSLQPLVQPGKWPALPRGGGSANDVAVVGQYAYVALGGAGLVVIDVSDPANCVRVGACDTPGDARRVVVSGNYAYLADGDSGLQVVDVSNPTNCMRVGGCATGEFVWDVTVSGNHAYVPAWGSGLRVIDVSDPTRCVLMASVTGITASGVAVAGNYAYVADYHTGLTVIDVTNLTNCEIDVFGTPGNCWAGGFDTMGYAKAVAVVGSHAYLLVSNPVFDEEHGLLVIDVSDPANCRRVGGHDNRYDAIDVVVSGNYAYIVEKPTWTGSNYVGGGLQVIDVSNPTNCVRVGSYDTSGEAVGVAVSGNYAYVADSEAGLQVIDVSNPTNCVRVGGYDTGGRSVDVAVSGNYAYVADWVGGLQVIDASMLTNCVRVGGFYGSAAVTGVEMSGNYAYVMDWYGALHVLDGSVPTNVVRVGGYDTGGLAGSVKVSGDYAYIVGGGRFASLWVVDVSKPTNCLRIGGFGPVGPSGDDGSPHGGWWPIAWALAGNHAYISYSVHIIEGQFQRHTNAVLIFDVSDPTNCVMAGSLDTWFSGIVVSGNYAYLAKGDFQVVDVSDPTNWVRVGSWDIGGGAWDVTLAGDYAYVAAGTAGVKAIDVSNPTNCVLVASFETKGIARKVKVAGGRIYVADDSAGLLVLPSLPNVQFTVRVDATPDVPFTLEAATDLSAPFPWTPLLTTNVPTMPFDFVDCDVKRDKPQKFYRVRQPQNSGATKRPWN